jgi:hypothetical protein
MATLSQILAGLRADQQLGQKETLGMLGSSIFESEKSIKEGSRAYQEAADDVGLDIQDYGEKGAKIDTLQTLGSIIPGAAVPLAILGFGARRARKKPKFTFDINKAAPGFEDRLFADQAGKDLLSSIQGTRDIVSQALKGSFFNDLVSTATSLYGGYQAAELAGTVSEGTSFMDFLRNQAKETDKAPVVDATRNIFNNDSFNTFRSNNYGLGDRSLYNIGIEE